MGFNSQDAKALNRASLHHFPTTSIPVAGDKQTVMCIEVGQLVPLERTAEILSNAMMDAERFFSHGATTTVWVDVTTDEIPPFVTDAIVRCSNYGLGLIVTHNGKSSHAPGDLISVEQRQVVSKASRTGMIWHPLADILVQARPAKG